MHDLCECLLRRGMGEGGKNDSKNRTKKKKEGGLVVKKMTPKRWQHWWIGIAFTFSFHPQMSHPPCLQTAQCMSEFLGE